MDSLETLRPMSASEDDGVVEEITNILKLKHETEEPFYVLDLAVVKNLMNRWLSNLPGIQPYYAVKCNTNRAILAALAALGSNFDCASLFEIQSVLDLGVSPDRIIYANACKSMGQLQYAAAAGVNLTTFDSVGELKKIRKSHPKCNLLIRVRAPDESGCQYPLGSKFGALPEEVIPLLRAARQEGLRVVGVSFHIGSGSHNTQAYGSAIESAKVVFEEAAWLGMPPMTVLNIGGGFMATSRFEEASLAVKAALDTYFPVQERCSLTLIAEPGRYFAETAFLLVANIIGKRVRGDLRQYWINEGFYASMTYVDPKVLAESCIPLTCKVANVADCDDENPVPVTHCSTVFGPTCAAVDTLLRDHQLPELEVNDWLVFRNMGSYTSACGSNFNGFGPATTTYLINEPMHGTDVAGGESGRKK